MEDEVLKDYIQKQLHQKGIDIKTQDYITDYIHMNQKLFGNTLNTNKIVDRILNNIENSIKTFDKEQNMSLKEKFHIIRNNVVGLYSPDYKQILVDPIKHIKGHISTKEQKRETSVIMHEIDHAATTTAIEISEQDKDRYIDRALYRRRIFDDKRREEAITNSNDRYYKNNKKLFVSGIDDPRTIIDQGINLKGLNEGITAYKQELYDNYNGIKPRTGYREEKKLAKQVADAIGKENLISKHFDGDYEGIRQMFNDRTGQDLNYLVKELNTRKVFRDPISKAMHKIISKIRNHSGVEVLSPANKNFNNTPQYDDTLQNQLAEQVNTPQETLMKDVEDITNQRSEINLNHQELKKEVDTSMVR